MPRSALHALLLAPLAGARLLARDPLAVPDGPYDPNDLLCRRGEKRKLGWCMQWLSCIRQKAEPQGSPESVMKAWGPADCREYCGVWPVTSGLEGGNHSNATDLDRFSLAVDDRIGNATALLALRTGTRSDCEKSCENFQRGLSSCVATILFEPGKVVNMGMPDGKPQKSVPSICSIRNTSCMPSLPYEYQKCVSQRAGKTLGRDVSADAETRCKMVKVDFEDCKECPQLSADYNSHYHSFVGGCMDQLNAYWAATHPDAGKSAAIPGASGCTVHL